MGSISYAQQVEHPSFHSLCSQQGQAEEQQSTVPSEGITSTRLESVALGKWHFFRLCVAPHLDPGVIDVKGSVESLLPGEAMPGH